MLKKVLWKAVVLVGVVVAILFSYSNKALSVEEILYEAIMAMGAPLIVKYLSFDIKTSDRALDQVDPLYIKMGAQRVTIPYGGGSIGQIEVRGFHNGETIFFRLTWFDATKNEKAIKHEQFRDAVALMFPWIL